uniref:Uncharacterized protein n=1 Tax=Oryza meridionalis TaxID=40149 RepID=A0A0E0DQ05_9ORYZ
MYSLSIYTRMEMDGDCTHSTRQSNQAIRPASLASRTKLLGDPIRAATRMQVCMRSEYQESRTSRQELLPASTSICDQEQSHALGLGVDWPTYTRMQCRRALSSSRILLTVISKSGF